MTSTSSGTGLKENVASLLCYLLWWITGIIFLILEPNNKTIKFHAWQSIITLGAIWIVCMVFGWIPIIGWIVGTLLGILGFILWIVLMYKAYQGVKYKLPIAGDIAEKLAG